MNKEKQVTIFQIGYHFCLASTLTEQYLCSIQDCWIPVILPWRQKGKIQFENLDVSADSIHLLHLKKIFEKVAKTPSKKEDQHKGKYRKEKMVNNEHCNIIECK